MKNRDWNNFCMKKYGGSIRNKIYEAYMPFAKGHKLTKEGLKESSKTSKKIPTIN